MPRSLLPLSPPALSGWFVVSLRPVGQHRRLLRAAEALGAEGLSLPGMRLAAREDTPTRDAYNAASRCSRIVFTSPSAVRFSIRLRTFRAHPHQCVFALGEATRAALHRAGVADVRIPPQATSESLLELPEMRELRGIRIGIVSAPDGRGWLEQRLREDGAIPVIAEVYARSPARLNRMHAQRLLDARGQGAACITSAEALRNVVSALPAGARATLLDCVAIASSERLVAIARDAGFRRIIRADSPTPRDLLAALCAHAKPRGFR
jgi:uroporphyrinogen-III synthase